MTEREMGTERRVGSMRDRTSTAQEIQVWREELLQKVLRLLVFAGFFAVIVGSIYRITQEKFVAVAVFVIVYLVMVVITFSRRIDYTSRVRALLFLLYWLALQEFFADGRDGGARLFLVTFIFAAVIFLGERAGTNAVIVSVGTTAFFAIGFLTNFFVVSATASTTDPAGWAGGILVLLIIGAFIVSSINYLIPRLMEAMSQSGRLTRELTDYQAQLEDLVAQQELDLARRSAQLNAAAQVAREAAQVLELEQILDSTVRLISERFDFYHAGIYLVDEAAEYAVLQAASSEGGQVMLARGFQLKIAQQGIVGYVIRSGEPRIALDVDEDGVFLDVPDLPNTRSEIAVPLRTREGIIGALDVQSEAPGAFSEQDVVVLQTLSDQIALVISNAQLIRQAEARMDAERQVYQQSEGRTWTDVVADSGHKGFVRNEQGISPAEDIWHPRMEDATRSGEIVASYEEDKAVAIPIKVRGQVVGVIDAKKPDDAGPWTQDELNLLQTLGSQLDPALDSAQLYEGTQLRASRERFTREIADKMRRAPDMDALIRTTVEEIATIMDTSTAFVQLIEPSDFEDAGIVSDSEKA